MGCAASVAARKMCHPAAGRPVPRRKRRSGRILVVACLLVYALFGFVRQEVRLFQARRQVGELGRQLEALKAGNEELRRRLQFLRTDGHVEAVARERLGLVRPGEVAYMVVDSYESPEADGQ